MIGIKSGERFSFHRALLLRMSNRYMQHHMHVHMQVHIQNVGTYVGGNAER